MGKANDVAALMASPTTIRRRRPNRSARRPPGMALAAATTVNAPINSPTCAVLAPPARAYSGSKGIRM
jgi:hypothetical protein